MIAHNFYLYQYENLGLWSKVKVNPVFVDNTVTVGSYAVKGEWSILTLDLLELIWEYALLWEFGRKVFN